MSCGIVAFKNNFATTQEAVPAETMIADQKHQLLTKTVARHSTPTKLQSHSVSQFTSEMTKGIIILSHRVYLLSAGNNHSIGGLVDRYDKTLPIWLSMYCSKSLYEWDKYVDAALRAFNGTSRAANGFTPHVFLNGQEKFILLRYVFFEFAAEFLHSHQKDVSNMIQGQKDVLQ